jgi:hypothetical protein
MFKELRTGREFEYTDLEELNEKNPNFTHYTCHFNLLPNNPLTPPTPLCSRAVLSSNISSDGVSNSNQNAGILPARYTILAMSKQVVTYEFKKEYIVYIPGPLKSVFLNGIKSGFD